MLWNWQGAISTLEVLREMSGADAIFAYAVDIYDYQAFLVDAMMYDFLLRSVPLPEKEMGLESIGNRAQAAIEKLLLYRKGRGSGKQVLKWSVAIR